MKKPTSKKPLLQATRNYSLFSEHENQQPVSEKHVANIAQSMREEGFWPSKALSVYRDTKGGLVLIDGHHRLRAANQADVEVFYIVEPGERERSIGRANQLVRKWSSLSFAKLYASRGIEDYQILLNYAEKGLSLQHAASALSLESPSSGNIGPLITDGRFKVKGTHYADRILKILDSCKDLAANITKRAYVEAIGAILWVEEVQDEVLIKRINTNPSMIIPVGRRDQALDILEEVYNFRTQKKLPIQFLVSEKMKIRQPTSNKK